jgi:sugar O-acyltransferase (sialic acid O-acetyltransferase NeuD family)
MASGARQGMNAPKRDIIIVGAGGHARVLIDVLRRLGLEPAGAVDINPALHGSRLDDVPVIGDDGAVYARSGDDVLLVNGQGNVPRLSASGLHRRRAVFMKFVERGYTFMSVVSPDAIVSPRAVIGAGAQILTQAIVHPGSSVGMNTIVNTAARIDHDCSVGAHSHIAPGTILCGGVHIGEECHIGAGAVVVPGVRVGDRVVGGGRPVGTADAAPGTTVLGNPAKQRPAP